MYRHMLTNIVTLINILCIHNNFIIKIYNQDENINLQIIDENNDLICKKDFIGTKQFYNQLIDELIYIFGNDKLFISRLLQENYKIYEQKIYIDNLEFRFNVNSNDIEEVKNAAKRHQEINLLAQNHKSLKLSK